jgi:regulator of protease activity HflC (stomatin/prohibitin superfamily)
MDMSLIVSLALVLVAVIILLKTAVVVPQQSAYVVERLGKFNRKLDAGFHILFPFIDKVSYRHTLKE